MVAALKRLLDIIGAAVGLVLLSPLFLFLIYKIRKDGGSAFYGHTRIGKDGKPFQCWKFRSMVMNSKEVLEKYLANNSEAQAEWDRDFKLRDDPRITPVGQFLRKTSLDELPQLWNVLKGEMSLVGPRPVVQEELDKYYGAAVKEYKSMRPGLTGLWQVSGRNDVSYDERVAMDVDYVHHWSVFKDIIIIFKTIGVMVKKKGAY